MKSSNPALARAFQNLSSPTAERMTVGGTVNKSFMLLAILLIGAVYSWQSAFPGGWSTGAEPLLPGWYTVAILGAFVLALVISFKPNTAPYLAWGYAALEGLAIGAISVFFEARYPGIVLQAVFGTVGTFAGLLFLYKAGLVRATKGFRTGVMAATMGIFFIYLIDLVLNFFGLNVPFLHDTGPLGIGVSLVIVAVAALNLVLDFDFIEQGAAQGAPKYMEWYGAFGLLVTLVWLYLEMLRLLSKMRRN